MSISYFTHSCRGDTLILSDVFSFLIDYTDILDLPASGVLLPTGSRGVVKYANAHGMLLDGCFAFEETLSYKAPRPCK